MDTDYILKYDFSNTENYPNTKYNPENSIEFQNIDFSVPFISNTQEIPNTSIYSTNCSSKNTPDHIIPEYADNNGNDESFSDDLDEKKENSNKAFPKTKKSIRKKVYEPIIENKTIYRYEDNPDEYKKARKRIQNRESANRVRSRKKHQYYQIEEDLLILKKKNEELLIANATLSAENNLLKQQIIFLQKVVMKSNNSESFTIENTNKMNDPNYLLPVKNPEFCNIQEENEELFRIRVPSLSSPRKHLTFFGIITILIYVFSANISEGNINGKNKFEFSDQFKHRFDRSLKSFNGTDDDGITLENGIEFLWDQHYKYNNLVCLARYFLIGILIVYLFLILYNFGVLFWQKKKLKKI